MKLRYFGLAALAVASGAQANLITPFETQFATDYASAGVSGLRGNGAGDIVLTGVSGTVSKSYLYWHGPTNSSDPTHNATMTFNGTTIVGTNIGFSDDNFWGRDNSQAYRADVTSLVTGDGTYSLDGLIANDSNGASLITFFDDGDSANNVDVVAFDGNDSNFANPFDPVGWDVTLSDINYTSGSALLSLTVSDGQDFSAFDDGTFILNGFTLNTEDLFDGTTVPEVAGSSVTNGGLWDILEIDVTSFLTPGLNTLNLTHTGINDALSAIHFAVILPAGAAPEQPMPGPGPMPMPPPTGVTEPSTLGLLGLALAAFGFNRRRQTRG